MPHPISYLTIPIPRRFVLTEIWRFLSRAQAEVFLPTQATADSAMSAAAATQILAAFDELTNVLGLLYTQDEGGLDAEVDALIEARQTARREKNWAEADRIRDVLKEMGIVLEDTPQGVKWKRG